MNCGFAVATSSKLSRKSWTLSAITARVECSDREVIELDTAETAACLGLSEDQGPPA